MFYLKDEVEVRKLVSFYSVYTSTYFSLLILILYFTDIIYAAGKYKFNAVILFIIGAEIFKYFASHFYFKAHDVNLSKKYDKSKGLLMRNVFTKPRLREGFKNAVVVFLMILVYFILAVLYGAEVFNKHEETFMFSSLLSVLTIFPACLNLGSQSVASLILGSKPINKLESLLSQNLYLTVFGAWLGAFVIPLDWDRPWQVWPIPCSLGAMIGFDISHIITMIKERGVSKKKNKRLM